MKLNNLEYFHQHLNRIFRINKKIFRKEVLLEFDVRTYVDTQGQSKLNFKKKIIIIISKSSLSRREKKFFSPTDV